MLSAIPDIMLQIHRDGTFVNCQGHNDELLALPKSEFLNRKIDDVMPAAFAKAVMQRVSETLRTGESQRFEYQLPVPLNSDHILDFEARFSTVNDDEVLVLVRDTTSRRKAEEALRVRDRALASTSNGVLITDPNQPDNPIIFCNAAFERITGYTEREILGRNCRFLQNDDGDQPGLDEVRAAIREQRDCRVTLRNYRKNGEMFWNELMISPVFDDQGRLAHFVAIQNDITEREELITELEAKNTELERFAYTISHDLRNPLVTIRGFAGLLEKDAIAGDTERMAQDQRRISEAAERMEALLNNLLELSRIGRVVSEPIELQLEDVIHEAMELLAGPIAARNVQVNVATELPIIRGDHQRMVEVYQNIIDNAMKFAGDQPKPQIEIGVRQEAGETVCFVRDDGIGIDPRHHDKVFGLFNRLDPESVGTGFGLTLVQRIIESHGGRVWVESEGKGKGCTFCFATEETTRAGTRDK